jgi:hypothetical protein
MLIAIVQALQTVWDSWFLANELRKYRAQKVTSLLFLGIIKREVEVCNGMLWLSSTGDNGVLDDC